MDILIHKDTLIEALQVITPITDKSSTKPVLSNFLLTTVEGQSNQVEFLATDYEISIRGRYAAKVSKPGAICVSAKKLLEICREFLADEVKITADDQLWVTVEAGSARLRMPSLEIGLYPRMETNTLPQVFSIHPKDLREAIDHTLFSIQLNEARKTLMGVCLNVSTGKQARWISTDGHRLAQFRCQVAEQSLTAPPEVIVPKKSLTEIRKVLEGLDEQVTVRFDERSLQLETPSTVVLTRLIEGKFPNVDPIIPKDNDKTLLVDRERFTNALKIISLMSGEKIKPVKLSIENGQMKLESERMEFGDASDQISANYNGEPMQIGFNARYLLEVLSVLQAGQQVSLSFKGALNPCLITVPGDERFLSVIMPLRIEW